jgi:hypothetical protein
MQELEQLDEAADVATVGHLRRCKRAMDGVISGLALIATHEPITLLGVAATPAIYNTLLTAVAAAVPLIGANLVPLLRETYAGPFPWTVNSTMGPTTQGCGG